ncbi:MAG TPA: ABC transporter permease, partial [Acidimicrobiales bacterium]|nr:ABC transporter permease [Acidimicrobiales bacterium]
MLSSGRFGFVRRRLVQLPFLVFGITVVTFFLIRLIPGNPALVLLGTHYTASGARQLDRSLGLDRSLPEQYWLFLLRLLHGNLGYSYFENAPARTVIAQNLDPTLFLVCYAALICAAIAIPCGLWAGMRPGRVFDQTSRVVFIVTFAMPSFWLGLILVLLFSIKVHAFPIDGYGTNFADHFYYLFLPAFALALPFSTVIVRALRSSVISVSATDFVDTARIKGISEQRVLVRHITRNAVVTVVAIFGVNLAYLVGGTVIVENVFSVPGLGSLLVSSVSDRDYPV